KYVHGSVASFHCANVGESPCSVSATCAFLNTSTWTKFALAPTCFFTLSTMSTLGPHVREVQNLGVAKMTTDGLFVARASAIVISCMEHGGVRVQMGSTPRGFETVGLCEAIARPPTVGEGDLAST